MATVNELLIRVRRKLGDMQKLKFSDEELILAMNDAINSLSAKLTLDLEAEMIKPITITGTTPVNRPEDFIRLVGQFPVEFYTDNGVVKLKHLDTGFTGTLEVRYFATKAKMATLTDTVPFSRLVHQTMLVDETVGMFGDTKVKTAMAEQAPK